MTEQAEGQPGLYIVRACLKNEQTDSKCRQGYGNGESCKLSAETKVCAATIVLYMEVLLKK